MTAHAQIFKYYYKWRMGAFKAKSNKLKATLNLVHAQGSCAIFINILDFVEADEIAKFIFVSKRLRDKIIPTLIKWTDRRILKNFQLLKRNNKTFSLFSYSKHLMTISKDLRWKEHKPLIDKATMEPFKGLLYQHFSQCYLDAERTKIFVSGGHKEKK